MFSHRFDTSWSTVETLSPSRRTYDVGDPAIASLLWDPHYGSAGGLDASVAAESAAVKHAVFANQIFPIVPLYVTSICAEHCTYCNYRVENKGVDVERLRLGDSELLHEAEFLISQKGLRVIELVYATDPRVRVDAICRHIELVRNLLEHHGGGMVGINCEAFDEADYRQMRSAGLEFAVLWMETYDRTRYEEVHQGATKKTRFEYRLDGYERMIAAGLKYFGMGVLSGLSDWRRDWAMLMQHEAYLAREYGRAAAILGVPRLKNAAGAKLTDTGFIPTAQEFVTTVALHNRFSPGTLPFVSTREEWDVCLRLSAGGGCLFTFNCATIPGGYSLGHGGYQFPTLSFDAPLYAPKLMDEGFLPRFDWSTEVFESVRALEPAHV
jgi:2-iminoacetate synthase